MDLKARAKKLKTDIPAIFLSLKDKDTPLLAKIFAGITVGYALSPVDLIPDNVMERNRRKSEGIWKDGKPEKWYYAIPIVTIWIMILAFLLRIFI